MTPQAAAPTPASAGAPAKPARALRWLAGVVAVLACLAVFGLYTAPDFMVMLADQMWACF
ncbi:hypothetical protein [Acidovorax sp. Leaf78]|uniref:hypothetical protein n=1 Tax=Acidovorax sp. Leaf78 TaxID=1736237 RepID=UPI0006FBE9F8|nr:hypothetical protein [Acidovorax sp. Leaf78]KQO14250.1 hypothetical protein ASF16_18485 [Acidovorax sp. Leaf78]